MSVINYELVVSDQRGHFQRYPARILFRDRDGVMITCAVNGETIRRRLGHDMQGWFPENRRKHGPDYWLEAKRD